MTTYNREQLIILSMLSVPALMKKISLYALLTTFIAFLSACSTIASYKDKGLSFDASSRGVAVSTQDPIFVRGSSAFTPQGEEYLDHIAQLMKSKSRRSALIEVEHEKIGSRALNNELHEVRSLTLMKALVERGIDKYRLAFVEVTRKKPVYPPSSRVIFLDEDIREFHRPMLLDQ